MEKLEQEQTRQICGIQATYPSAQSTQMTELSRGWHTYCINLCTRSDLKSNPLLVHNFQLVHLQTCNTA